MRVFIAVAVPPEVDEALDGLEREVRVWARAEHVRLRWVPSGARHVTLRFVGECDDPEPVIEAVERAVAPASADPASRPASATRPAPASGPVPAGRAAPAPQLALGSQVELLGHSAVVVPVSGAEPLARAVARELRVAAPRFMGHVTVGRVRPRPVAPPPVSVAEAAWIPGSVEVIESRPGGTPRYVTLASLPVQRVA
ncbi:2'-5' RNA ligase family protein [Demequina pelophila]|uniref:2'-5' RNA ligase family protein n=1 Tax=Demequina pelophila TaxID=1638984 RepID=UPI000781CCD8|nr:hypothetical protein [Demequina pelophila]